MPDGDTETDPLETAENGLVAVEGRNDGINALPGFGTPTDPFVAGTPVGWTSKFVGQGGSNCKAPLPVFP